MPYPDSKDWNFGLETTKDHTRKFRSHVWQLNAECEWYECSECGTAITLKYLKKQQVVESIDPPTESALDLLWYMAKGTELPVHAKCPII